MKKHKHEGRPWHRWDYLTKGIPTSRTLRRWRKMADDLAKLLGCPGACHVCKRPVTERRRGHLVLHAPNAWHSQTGLKLPLCYSCWAIIRSMLDELQTKMHRDYLPPEEDEIDE
jgi:hypothetical protein